jgi:hypothetical protein
MFYSILIYVSEARVEAMTAEEDAAHVAQHLQIHEKLAAHHQLGPVVRLMPTHTARQLRTAGGDPTVVDGPFAETKEQLLGFYIVDCKSAEDAMNIARALPSVGTIFEVRPVKLFFPGSGLKEQTDSNWAGK